MLATDPSLTLAPSSSFCIRLAARLRSLGQAAGQAPPVAGQFPQLPLRALRDEAGLQQAATQQVGDPLGVPVSSTGQALHVGLAPRHRLHVPGIDHHHAELVLQYVVDRLPVDPGALHRHLGYLMARQPVGQGQQVLGHGGKAAHLLALRGDDAGRHPLLVHVQPAAPLVNGIHLPAPSVDGCRPAGDRRTRDFTMRALRRGGATFLGAWRSPRQFPARARSANDGRPSRRPAPPHFHPLRWPSQGHGISGESRNLRHPPTATPSKLRAATKPVPKITQIKRITVQDQAPPTSHHTTTPTRLSSETRNPRPLPTFRIPTSRRRRHAPHPSFRRKPESTSPTNRNPLEAPGGNQTSPKNHPNQTNHSSRPSAPHQPPRNHPHPSFQRNPEPNSTLHTPHSQFRTPHSALPIPNPP